MIDNVSSLLHLNHEAAGVGLNAVRGANACEQLVHHTHRCKAGWHKAAYLGHDHYQGHLHAAKSEQAGYAKQ